MNEKLSKSQRAMMAAHLLELAAWMVRTGNPVPASSILHSVQRVLIYADPGPDYSEALLLADLSPADIRAAVADIDANKHPDTSLPAMVEQMRNEVPIFGKLRHEGKVGACKRFLTMLGVEVPR